MIKFPCLSLLFLSRNGWIECDMCSKACIEITATSKRAQIPFFCWHCIYNNESWEIKIRKCRSVTRGKYWTNKVSNKLKNLNELLIQVSGMFDVERNLLKLLFSLSNFINLKNCSSWQKKLNKKFPQPRSQAYKFLSNWNHPNQASIYLNYKNNKYCGRLYLGEWRSS